MKIGILQTGHTPDSLVDETGDYGQIFVDMLADPDFEFQVYSVVDGDFPKGAEDSDGWLITGSRHGAYEDHNWIPPLEQLIHDIHARKLPLIGVCFGHQIIAQAFGGTVEKYADGWAVGLTQYDMGGQVLAVNAWHQDQVTRRPEGAQVLASNTFCENAILSYGDTIWTIQPHPEFPPGFVDGLISTRGRGIVPDALLDAAARKTGQANSNDDIAAYMIDFFKKERA